jgi:hypothetical protein
MPALKNPKHEAFCREVAGGLAYESAWVAIGNNEKARNASRLANQPKIQARIAELRAEFNASAGIQLRWLQEKLLPFVTADLTRYFESDDDGKLTLRDLTKLPADLRAALSEVSIDADGKMKFKVVDKLGAINALIKSVGGNPPEGGTVNFTNNMQLLRVVNDYDRMSTTDIARRVALTLTLGKRSLEAANKSTGTETEQVEPAAGSDQP